jgi:hypothetical protein
MNTISLSVNAENSRRPAASEMRVSFASVVQRSYDNSSNEEGVSAAAAA